MRNSSLYLSLSLSFLVLTACGTAAEGQNAGECADGADNDGNGAFDCDDGGCSGSPDCAGGDDTAASQNAAPSGAALAITPATPGDDDDLTCSIVTEATDPNGDTVTYRYAWMVNGGDAGVSGQTVSAAQTSGGESWTCTVTPNDGVLDGTAASASVTIAQGNRAPSAPTVSINPAEPTDDDVLTCVIDTESVDPDGDAVTYTYAWSVDGADTGRTGETLGSDITEVGQQWTCTAIASDGDLETQSSSASVEIGNTSCSLEGTYASFERGGACPMAHWDMSTLDRGGDIADLMGGNSLAIASGGAPRAEASGAIGQTYAITSENDYFLSVSPFDRSLLGYSPKSVSLWVNLLSFQGDGDSMVPIFSFGGPESGDPCSGSMMALYYAGEAKFAGCEAADFTGGGSWGAGDWHHMAAVYDGTDAYLYVDGTYPPAEPHLPGGLASREKG